MASTLENAFQSLAAAAERDDKRALVEADMAFHWAVCSPCGHELLLEHLKQLQVRTRLCIRFTKVYSTDAESEALSHRPILNAILSSDTDRAEAALRDHVLAAGQRLLVRLLESEPYQPKRRAKGSPNVCS